MSEMKGEGTLGNVNDQVLKAWKERERSGVKYALNKENLKKLNEMYGVFRDYIEEEEDGAKIFDPGAESTGMGVSVVVSSLELREEGMRRFLDVMGYMNTFTMSATEDGNLLITATVKDVLEVAE